MLRLVYVCMHAVATTPAGPWVLDRSCGIARSSPTMAAFPVHQAGRLPHYSFRGLLSVHSRYGLHARQIALCDPFLEGSDGFVTFAAAPIATGWSDPVAGREFHPLKTSALARRTEQSGLRWQLQSLRWVVTQVNICREFPKHGIHEAEQIDCLDARQGAT